MADINEELLRALNGPAPQHKKHGEQAFDFSEGEQGKLFTGNHVMTDSGLWVPQKGTDDGAAHTQLTGSNVEYEAVFERAVRTSSTPVVSRYDFKSPKGAKGAYVSLVVHGVTGTFSSNHGVNLRVRHRSPEGNTVFSTGTNRTTDTTDHLFLIYPGIDSLDYNVSSVATSLFSGIPASFGYISPQIEINGNFEANEGIDCELNIEWVW